MSEEIAATTATEQTPTEAASTTEAVVVSGQETAQDTAPAASGTLATSDPVEKPVAAPADFPEDWRQKLAGGDEKELARLQRMGSPADVWKAYRALEAKISSGQLKSGLKPGATPEEVAAWRKENGLPETPEGYVPQLPNGMVPGEADTPVIDWFKNAALKNNITPDQFNGVLSEFFAYQTEMKQQEFEREQALRNQWEDRLRSEWGPEYRSNLRGINNALSQFLPPHVMDRIWGARANGEDGAVYSLGNDPEVLAGLNLLARAINPMSTLVPAGSGDIMKAGEARISEIEQMMRTDPGAYWKNQDIQNEYGKLLEARESMRGRAA